MVGLITMGTSAALIQAGDAVYDRLRGTPILWLFGADPGAEPAIAPSMAGHIIVVGMNSLGLRIVRELTRRGESVLAVDVDAGKLLGLPCPTLQGSTEHPSVLAEAGLSRARLLVSALQIEDANKLLAYRSRQAGVPSSIHAFDPSLADELREDGATHVMVSKYDGIRQVATALRDAGVIG